MATIAKRKDKNGNTKYQVIIRLKGARSETATFARLTDAKRWAQDTESAIRDGRHFKTSEAKRHTLGEMIDKYISQFDPPSYKVAQLEWWKAKLGFHRLSDITPALIAEGRDELKNGITKRGTKRSPATTVRYLAALSHLYSIGIKEFGWVETSPVSKIQKPSEPPGRVRFLSDDERARLLHACKESSNPYLYTVVVLALSTGMRSGEIMSLEWLHVDLERKRIILEKTKNGSKRTIPLSGLALELLKEHHQKRFFDTNLLFPSKNHRKPMDLRRPWLKALQIAEITDFKFHDNRHSAASYMAMSGASLTEIGTILGHKRLEVTKRYSHLSQKHISSVVERMNQEVFGA